MLWPGHYSTKLTPEPPFALPAAHPRVGREPLHRPATLQILTHFPMSRVHMHLHTQPRPDGDMVRVAHPVVYARLRPRLLSESCCGRQPSNRMRARSFPLCPCPLLSEASRAHEAAPPSPPRKLASLAFGSLLTQTRKRADRCVCLCSPFRQLPSPFTGRRRACGARTARGSWGARPRTRRATRGRGAA